MAEKQQKKHRNRTAFFFGLRKKDLENTQKGCKNFVDVLWKGVAVFWSLFCFDVLYWLA